MEQDRRASIGERVEMKEEIGSGCYGKVYRAELVDDITGKGKVKIDAIEFFFLISWYSLPEI